MTIITQIPNLPRRAADSNKGSFGRILVVAGSRGMSGAAVLCASGALRGGAGPVRVAVPADSLATVAAGNPCYMTSPLPQDDEGKISALAVNELLELAKDRSVLAIGPGLGQSKALSQVVARILTDYEGPIVLDADGLNAFVEEPERLSHHAGPLVITPHPGEFARLLKSDVRSVQAKREELAMNFAREHKLVIALKGTGTIVTDGDRAYINTTGNPGMATGGSGDVLSGVVAALIGQGLGAFAATQLGVYLHGLAGDLARDELGEEGLIATDIVDHLPYAFKKYRTRS